MLLNLQAAFLVYRYTAFHSGEQKQQSGVCLSHQTVMQTRTFRLFYLRADTLGFQLQLSPKVPSIRGPTHLVYSSNYPQKSLLSDGRHIWFSAPITPKTSLSGLRHLAEPQHWQ